MFLATPLAASAADLDPTVQRAASENNLYISVFGGFTPRTELEINFFANVFLDYDTGTRFTPYVGGGLGFTRANFDL